MSARVGATLTANLVRAGLAFFSGIVVARALGAADYGDLYFLLGSFAAISQLLEMGTASAFYTFLARRRQPPVFLVLYLGWMAAQGLLTVLLVWWWLPPQVVERLWIGQERGLIVLAFAANFFMTQVWGLVSQLGEAARKTLIVQVGTVAQALVHVALVAAAAFGGWLTIRSVLWLFLGEFAVLAMVLGPRLMRHHLAGDGAAPPSLREIARDVAAYCRPLVLYAWVSCAYTLADRWLLQRFGGAEQQGFFAIAQQFANVSLIATTSILKVFWKEIAEAQARQDQERLHRLYAVVSRGLFFAGAWLSCLLIPYTQEILRWTLGGGYEGAWLCLALLLLYPVHQSMGQIGGTYLYATGETGRYTRLGLATMGASLPVTYLLLAAPSALIPGAGLGAVGLAIKMVGLQAVSVNLQAYVIARKNGWAYEYGYQLMMLGALLSLGVLCKWASRALLGALGAPAGPAEVMLVGSVLYLGACVGVVVYGTGSSWFHEVSSALRH